MFELEIPQELLENLYGEIYSFYRKYKMLIKKIINYLCL